VVNKENLNKALIQIGKSTLPFEETLAFIGKAAHKFIQCGESQFIDFIHSEELIKEPFNEQKAQELIYQFDFAVGSPVARQLLSYLMLKEFNTYNQYIVNCIKYFLISNAKKGLNIINQLPSSTVKASRSLMLIEKIEKENNHSLFFEDLFIELVASITKQNHLKKEDLNAPLAFWDEDTIKNIFYSLINILEVSTHSFLYFIGTKDEKIRTKILAIKENFLEKNVTEIFHECYFILKLLQIMLKNQENFKKTFINESHQFENEIYIERLGIQLSRRNEGILEIQSLQQKMKNLLNTDIIFKDLFDEEIHSIHSTISKESITRSRLEIRLNDTEYPLSVAYRDYITTALQHLED
jgi:hypothetical protein